MIPVRKKIIQPRRTLCIEFWQAIDDSSAPCAPGMGADRLLVRVLIILVCFSSQSDIKTIVARHPTNHSTLLGVKFCQAVSNVCQHLHLVTNLAVRRLTRTTERARSFTQKINKGIARREEGRGGGNRESPTQVWNLLDVTYLLLTYLLTLLLLLLLLLLPAI